MADTDKEVLKKNTLKTKALLQEQMKNEQKQKMDEASIKVAEERMAKIKETYEANLAASRKTGAGKGKDGGDGRSLKQLADEKIKELSQAGVAAYDDVRAAFTKLWDGYVAIAMAMSQTIDEHVHIPFGHQIAEKSELAWQLTQKLAKIPIFQDIIQGAKNLVTTEPDVLLPVLNSYVDCNEKNELVVNPVMRDDNGGELGSGFDDIFKENVEAWLVDQGYTSKEDNPKVFVNREGNDLTSEKLEELKSDPDHGLSNFLSAQYGGLSFKM